MTLKIKVEGEKRKQNRGRKKGTPNRATWSLREAFEKNGYDPAAEMIKVLRSTKDQTELFTRLAFVFRYLFPQVKEVEQVVDVKEEKASPALAAPTETLLKLAG